MLPNANVKIVGAGPIGLALAWGIKRINPGLTVVVAEKYEEYQRKHTLIMQHRQLEKLMKATGTEQDPTLLALLARLKKDPHIRTNELESIFKTFAIDSGVEIIIEEIKDETAETQLLSDPPKLLIGADGTHSLVNRVFFPANNQVKYEYDYVLQLRYEINGKEQSEDISTIDFYQQMARQGLIANEYVGHFDGHSTPVTMQMMISKQDFEALKAATSKRPFLPFVHDEKAIAEQPIDDLPEKLRKFINKYLAAKIMTCHKNGEIIDRNSIRVSVNEAPATRAKQVHSTYHNVPVVLKGDAGLGLSYFLGLNAGLEATASFLTCLTEAMQNNLSQPAEIQSGLKRYADWYAPFAEQKIKEVEHYSTTRIRSAMRIMENIQAIKAFSCAEDIDDMHYIIDDYFEMFAENPLLHVSREWKPYPHRDYDPVALGQFAYVPIKHSLKKIWKLVADYVKPYKSSFQMSQDFKQPLIGSVNFSSGLVKIVVGLLTLHPKRFADGIFSLLRGSIELLTTPLAWTIKPITRAIATLIHKPKRIEENTGMKKLVQYGQNYLSTVDTEQNSPVIMHELLAVCTDMHRKYIKAASRGQISHIFKNQELACFSRLRSNKQFSADSFRRYFALFSPKVDMEQENQTEQHYQETRL